MAAVQDLDPAKPHPIKLLGEREPVASPQDLSKLSTLRQHQKLFSNFDSQRGHWGCKLGRHGEKTSLHTGLGQQLSRGSLPFLWALVQQKSIGRF